MCCTNVGDGTAANRYQNATHQLEVRVRELINQPIIQGGDEGARLNEPGGAVLARTPWNPPVLFAIAALAAALP